MLGFAQLFLFGGKEIEGANKMGSCLIWFDDIVNIASFGRDPGRQILVFVFLLMAKPLFARRSSVDDLHGALCSHDGDFC